MKSIYNRLSCRVNPLKIEARTNVKCLNEQEHCCRKYYGGNSIQRRISAIYKRLSHFQGVTNRVELDEGI